MAALMVAQAKPGKRKQNIEDYANSASLKRMKSEMTDDDGTGEEKVKSEINDDVDNCKESDEREQEEEDDGAYNEAKERYPNCLAYDAEIPIIKDAMTSLAQQAEAVILENQCDSEDVQRLLMKAREASRVPAAQPKMIGLLGDAGTGKSSLLNSITDISRLAKALDAGKSVTFVVTLYRRARPDQKKPFSAKVEFFDVITIGKILVNALDDWFQFYFEPHPEWTNEQQNYYESRALTARSTFRAILCDNPLFESDDAATEALNKFASMGANRVTEVRIFAEHVADKLSSLPHEGDNAYEYMEADDQDELREMIDPLTTEDPCAEEPSLWPFIKQVTIGVQGSRVLDHFSLADLPGISDVNQVRVKATQDHIKKCDELWIVARAGRIITDSVVSGLLQRYAQVFRGRVRIMATKVDDNVTHELALELRKMGFSIGEYAALKDSSTLMQTEIKNLNLQKRKLGAAKKSEKDAAQRKLDSLMESRRRIENHRWESVVHARNEHITKKLQMEKRRHYPSGITPKISCVSNTHYHALKGEVEAPGQFLLSPSGTGVPGLRAAVLQSAAPFLREHLEAFISTDFTVFIRGLELWAESSNVEGRSTLIAIVRKPRSELPAIFEDFENQIANVTRTCVHKPIVSSINRLSAHAIRIVNQTLKPKSWATWKAFIKRYGSHRTSVMAESWNELFSEACTDVLREAWEPFLQVIEKHIQELQDRIAVALGGIMAKLNKDPHTASLGAIAAFEGSLDARIAGIKQRCKEFQEKLMQQLGVIYLRAISDDEHNYMRNAILQAYESCLNDSSKGIKDRSIATFITHFSLQAERSPFAVIATAMEKGIISVIRKESIALRKLVDKLYKQILQDFETMINQKTDDKTEIPVRQALKEFLVTAKPEFERIKGWMEEVKARYPAEQRVVRK